MRIKKYFFEIHESALDSVDITICKVQHSTILILKVGKLVRIEYIDKDVYLEHKENKNIQMFFQSLLFLARALSLSRKLKLHRTNSHSTYHISLDFQYMLLATATFYFSFASLVSFVFLFSLVSFVFCLCFLFETNIYSDKHLAMRVSKK